MIDMLLGTVLYGIAPAVVVAGLLWSVAAEPEDGAGRRWAGVLAAVGGFHVGYILLNWRADEVGVSLLGFVGEPKQTGYIVAVALAVGLLDAFGPEPDRHVVSALFAGAVTGLMYLMVGDLFGDPWSSVGTIVRIGVVAVGFGAMHWTLEQQARRAPGATMPLVLTILGTGAAAILALRGAARIGEHLGLLTAAAGAAIPIARWRPSLRLSGGAVSAFLMILVGLATTGYFYMFGPPLYAALVWLVAPQAIWIAEIGPLGKLSGWKHTASRVMCVAVALTAAIVIAWTGSSSF